MAAHSSVLAWRIPWTEEPGGLLSRGLHRVRHGWSNLACMHWEFLGFERIYFSSSPMSLGRHQYFFCSLLSQFFTNIQTWKSHFAPLFLFPWLGWAMVDAGCYCGRDVENRWMELSGSIQHSCPRVSKGLCGDSSPVKRKVLQGSLPGPQKMQQTQWLGEASTFLSMGCWGARHQIAFWVFVVVCFLIFFPALLQTPVWLWKFTFRLSHTSFILKTRREEIRPRVSPGE